MLLSQPATTNKQHVQIHQPSKEILVKVHLHCAKAKVSLICATTQYEYRTKFPNKASESHVAFAFTQFQENGFLILFAYSFCEFYRGRNERAISDNNKYSGTSFGRLPHRETPHTAKLGTMSHYCLSFYHSFEHSPLLMAKKLGKS